VEKNITLVSQRPDPASNCRQTGVGSGIGKQVTMVMVLAAKDCTAYIDCLGLSSDIHGNVAAAFSYFSQCVMMMRGRNFFEDINLFAVIFSSDFLSVFSFFLPSELGGMTTLGMKM
jgi:hypothetical protein